MTKGDIMREDSPDMTENEMEILIEKILFKKMLRDMGINSPDTIMGGGYGGNMFGMPGFGMQSFGMPGYGLNPRGRYSPAVEALLSKVPDSYKGKGNSGQSIDNLLRGSRGIAPASQGASKDTASYNQPALQDGASPYVLMNPTFIFQYTISPQQGQQGNYSDAMLEALVKYAGNDSRYSPSVQKGIESAENYPGRGAAENSYNRGSAYRGRNASGYGRPSTYGRSQSNYGSKGPSYSASGAGAYGKGGSAGQAGGSAGGGSSGSSAGGSGGSGGGK
jgi:hypothetical protein